MKRRFTTTIITAAEVVVTVSMSTPVWGLTIQPAELKPVANETSKYAVSIIACDKTVTTELENGVQEWLKFQRLVKDWDYQRGASSSITKGIIAPAYQHIIGMGPAAVPLILHQLRSEGDDPDQWFWALESITGENPTRPEDQGNYLAMAKSWLQWAEENYVG